MATALHTQEKLAADTFTHAVEVAQDLYRKAEKKLPDGAAPAILAGAGVLAVGTAAYLVGRARGSTLASTAASAKSQLKQAVAPVADKAEKAADAVTSFDYEPILKFARLWLLSRVFR